MCDKPYAKPGVRYDEVTDRTLGSREALARAEERRAAAEGACAALRTENASLASRLKQKEHEAELLSHDKAYQSKEVEALTARAQQSAAAAERAAMQLAEVTASREELQQRMLETATDGRRALEEKVAAEVAKLQAKHSMDAERLRQESTASFTREIGMLREMRDAAAMEAEAARLALTNSRKAHDELLLAHRSLQQRADLQQVGLHGCHSLCMCSRPPVHAEADPRPRRPCRAVQVELSSEVKLKSFELERMRILHDSASSAAREADLQIQARLLAALHAPRASPTHSPPLWQMLQRKTRALETQYYAQEAESARRLAEADAAAASGRAKLEHYEMLERDLDEEITRAALAGPEAPGGPLDTSQLATRLAAGVPAARPLPFAPDKSTMILFSSRVRFAMLQALRRRVEQSLSLARRVRDLERQLEALSGDKSSTTSRLREAESEVRRLKERLTFVQQPYHYLVERLQAAEDGAESATQRAGQLTTELAAAQEALFRARADREVRDGALQPPLSWHGSVF